MQVVKQYALWLEHRLMIFLAKKLTTPLDVRSTSAASWCIQGSFGNSHDCHDYVKRCSFSLLKPGSYFLATDQLMEEFKRALVPHQDRTRKIGALYCIVLPTTS